MINTTKEHFDLLVGVWAMDPTFNRASDGSYEDYFIGDLLVGVEFTPRGCESSYWVRAEVE